MKSKIITVLVSAAALILIFSAAAFADPIKGDLNGDGNVTVEDARYVLRGAIGLARLSDMQLKAADFNDDMEVNVEDARLVLRHAIGLDKPKEPDDPLNFEKVLYEHSHAMLGSEKQYIKYDVTGILKNYQKWCSIYTIDDVLRPVLGKLGYTQEAIDKLAPHTFPKDLWFKLFVRNNVPVLNAAAAAGIACTMDNVIPPSLLMAYYERLEQEEGLCKIYNLVTYLDNDVSGELRPADEDEIAEYKPEIGDIVYITNKTMLVKDRDGESYNQLIHTAQITKVNPDGTFMCTEGSIVEPSEGDGIARVREREYFWSDDIATNYDAYGEKIEGKAAKHYSSYVFRYNSTVVVLAVIRPDWSYTGK